MRLWHKDLICVLPREQLVAQWRECSAIAGNILTKGTPNHILVNKIMDYSMDHFITYAAAVRAEMTSRGYRTMNSVWEKIIALKPRWTLLPQKDVYSHKMSDFYLTVCYYNLAEKESCGMIPTEDWNNIVEVVKKNEIVF